MVIQVYAPTSDSSDEELEMFYEQLDEGQKIARTRDLCIVCGDFNAKIGSNNEGWDHVMGKYGIGERNERGDRLLQFAQEKGLYVANTKYPSKESRKSTWISPGGRHRNMIDFVMVQQQWSKIVQQCRSFPSADIASDHELVLCNLDLKLTRYRQRKAMKNTKRWNLEKLKQPITHIIFETQVATNLEQAHTESIVEIDNLCNTIVRTIEDAADATIKSVRTIKKPWISDDTMRLVEQKRTAKAARMTSDDRMAIYRQLCKDVKKAARKDKENWIKQQCEMIEKCHSNKKTRETHKMVKKLTGDFKKSVHGINNKQGKKLTEQKDITERWTEYARELYTDDKVYDPATLDVLRNRFTCAEDEDVEDILLSEVEKAVKTLKDKKSPGIDGIPAEVIKAGGERLIKDVHRLCNMIWHEEQWPEEWTRSILITIPKKGDRLECANYRTIALISHVSKILLMVLLERLKAALEQCLSEEQGGFREDRGTVQQILTLRLINEKYMERRKPVYHCFVDYTKAFDTVWHDGLWAVLDSYKVPRKLVKLLRNLYSKSELAVRINGELGEWFMAEIGSRQGDPLSPLMFITLLERVMEQTECNTEGIGLNIHGRILKDLRYADDVDLMAETENGLQELLTSQAESSRGYGLQINRNKTKVLVCTRNGSEDPLPKITVNGEPLECVTEYVYLGSLITQDNDCSPEIRRRINLASQTMGMLKTIWRSRDISITTKVDLLVTCVFSRLLYAAETWTLKAADENRLRAFETRCYRRLLGIHWFDRVTNEAVRTRVGRAETVVDTVRKRKMELFGHICRMNGERMLKTVVTGMVDGSRGRGRPARRWIDDITKWCNCTIPEAVRKAGDRRTWRSTIELSTGLYGPSGT